MLIRRDGDVYVPWRGEPINGVQHPLIIERRWSEAELNAIGLYLIESTPVPDGQRVVSTSWILHAGKAKEVHQLTPITYNTSNVLDERDRRIAQNFVWNGHEIQARPDDRENIIGASLSATLAIMSGAQPGDTQWAGGNTDFTWIVANNDTIVLDAHQMVDMGTKAMQVKKFYIYKAKEIKEAVEANNIINIYDDNLWR